MVKDRSQRAVTTPVLNHCTTVTARRTTASACSCDTEMAALGSGSPWRPLWPGPPSVARRSLIYSSLV